MDTRTGEVFTTLDKETEREFLARIGKVEKDLEHFIEVRPADMTEAQKKRLVESDQPVVRPADQRSKLAKTRNQRKRENRALRARKRKK